MGKSMTKRERRARKAAESTREETSCREVQPETVTPEWALERLSEKMTFETWQLLQHHEISNSEVEEVLGMMRRAVITGVAKYDPTSGASAVHYLVVAVENVANRIHRYNERRRNRAVLLSLTEDIVEAAHEAGMISTDAPDFSDNGRTVKSFEYRDAVRTLFALLDPVNRLILMMRYQGYTDEEIGDVLGCSRQKIQLVHSPVIVAAAHKCGFYSQEEIKSGAYKLL